MTDAPQPTQHADQAAEQAAAAAPSPNALAPRLREVIVALRGELDVSRHRFREGPAYVLRDPVTFATHRFDPEDYAILNTLRQDWTLGETFDHLVAAGVMHRDEEEGFYEFILDLHQRSLLTLPVNNADALYQRFERRRRAERLSKLMGIFFLRVPLVNPDRFLSRTIGLTRWMFTLPALIAWLVLVAAGGWVAVARFDDLAAPAMTILDGQNMILLWVALIGLKIIHEFGHAYACKAFGGHVPEMGAFFILFTPVAYVDATDSWTFPSARRRAIVTLGGVYFESIVGVIALFVWAATETSLLNAFAYQVVILATVTTAAFNLNPLLRYDAYYLVSDLVAIPNLRARCREALAALSKRIVFGLKRDTEGDPLPVRPALASFGLAQLAYRVVMLGTISTVLVMKFGTPGILLAAIMVGLTVFKACASVARYVLASEEVAPVRVRASLATFGVAGLLLAGILSIPLPWPVNARGIVSFEQTRTLRATASGVLTMLPERVGAHAAMGQTIARLENPESANEREALLAEIEAAGVRVANAAFEAPSAAAQPRADEHRLHARLDYLNSELASLEVRAPASGRVLSLLAPHTGVRVEAGDPLLVFASGEPEAVFHVRAFEFDAVRLTEGDLFECRSVADPDCPIVGRVTQIVRVGTREIESRVASSAPDGLVPLSADKTLSAEPFFEIRVRLDASSSELAGAALVAELPTRARTTAAVLHRRVARFLNRMKEGADR